MASKLEICLVHKEFRKGPSGSKKVTTDLAPKIDYNLSWIEYFKKQKNDVGVFKKIVEKNNDFNFTIMDRRAQQIRKIWNLNSKIKDFIDSFGRNRQTYKADLGNLPANTSNSSSVGRPVQPQQINSRPGGSGRVPILNVSSSRNNASRVEVRLNEYRSGTRSQGQGPSSSPHIASPVKRRIAESNDAVPPPKTARGQGRQEATMRVGAGPSRVVTGLSPTQNGNSKPSGPFAKPRLPAVRFDFDAASMASSQDSQLEELMAEGIPIEEIKSKFIAALVKHVDNSSLLRMRNELQKLLSDGQYLRACRHFPQSAQLFNILLYNLNPQ